MSNPTDMSKIINEDGIYIIPVSWMITSVIKVEADNLEQAVAIANDKIDDIPLSGGEYVEGSYAIESEKESIIYAQNYRDLDSTVLIKHDGTIES